MFTLNFCSLDLNSVSQGKRVRIASKRNNT